MGDTCSEPWWFISVANQLGGNWSRVPCRESVNPGGLSVYHINCQSVGYV